MSVRMFRRCYSILAAFGLLVIAPVVYYGHAFADSPGAVISRGFTTNDSGIVEAALVSTTSRNSSDVELATLKNSNRLAGLVTKASLVELSANQKSKVQVA